MKSQFINTTDITNSWTDISIVFSSQIRLVYVVTWNVVL